MAARPTLAEIAAKAGLSKGAISQALNDNPRIPVATRKRVRRIAEALGYRPDPELTQQMVLTRRRRHKAPSATLAVWNAWEPRIFTEVPAFQQELLGVKHRRRNLVIISTGWKAVIRR